MTFDFIAMLGLFIVGVMLSAFFSGAETGFYRATRLRLVLDARSGGFIARRLWWLSNRPALFIATTLVGNNLANYLTSLSIVSAVAMSSMGSNRLLEMLAPILIAPLVFVYGELMPKSLFYEAPNRLLRKCGPFFLFSMVVFVVPSMILWGMSKLLEWASGESPQRIHLALARRELRQVLDEGHDVGLLEPVQRGLAQGLLAVAYQPAKRFSTPPARMPRVRLGMPKSEILRMARRQRLACIPFEEPLGRRRVIGYVRVVDLYMGSDSDDPPIRDMLEIPVSATHIAALIAMQAAREPIARLVNADGDTEGVITIDGMTKLLFRAS